MNMASSSLQMTTPAMNIQLPKIGFPKQEKAASNDELELGAVNLNAGCCGFQNKLDVQA